MDPLQLSFLGGFQAALNDKPLTHFRSIKIQGLLVYLVLTPQQAHTREQLATMFWPDEPDANGKKNLRQSLYRLRHLLGDTNTQEAKFFRITRATVQFNPTTHVSLDVADFLAALKEGELETAVSQYHGDLLPGFNCDSLPFDDWLRQEREHLHHQALDALNKLTTHSLTRADFSTAARFARQQLRLEPWREEAHRQLMQALALRGERSAALAQFETCRTVLAQELGIEPTAETVTLARRIRETQVKQPAQRDAERRLTIPFVGRKPEFEALVKSYQRAMVDGLQVVTLSGKAGMGKTRLTQHFIEWAAAQGADVLHGRTFETSAGLSYQPLTHLLRQRVEAENAPEDLLSDLWLSQLTRLLPELRDRYPDLPEPTQEENIARQHLFEAVTRLMQALAARRPLLLFIDDWHWADSASRDLLHYAAVRWAEEQLPVMVLLTLRQEAVDELPDVQSWLTRLHHTVAIRPLQLTELSQPDTVQLLQQLLMPKAEDEVVKLTQFSQWLFTETDGQPLFLIETLKSLVADGLVKPNTDSSTWHIDWKTFDEQRQIASEWVLPEVQQIVRGWLERISMPARTLLTAASVLAKEITFDQLCQVAALDQFEALNALDELLGKQLLIEVGELSPALGQEPAYRFSHQKVSNMVYTEAGTARQRLLHKRAFETLLAEKGSAADLAHHALNAGLLNETIRQSLRAGNEAMALFAHHVAITHYETAWKIARQLGWPETISGADRKTLYSQLGRAYELTEAWNKAKETYEAMITAAQTMGATAMECLGLNRLATVYNSGLFDPQHAFTLLAQAQRVTEQSDDARGRAETAWNLARTSLFVHDLDNALIYARQALAIACTLDHPQFLARCLQGLSFVYMHKRYWEQAERYGAEAQQRFTAAGNLVDAAGNQRVVGACQLMAGRPQAGLVTLQDALAFSQTIENLPAQVESAWFLALVHMELGNYGEAVRLAKQATVQADKVALKTMIHIAQTVLGMVYRAMMALDAAKQIQAAIFETIASGEFVPYPDRTLTELCAAYALAGEWKQAYACAQKAMKIHQGSSLLPVSLVGWYETEALLRGGDGDMARAEVERVASLVGSNRRYQLPLLRSRAVLAWWDGEVAQGITHLQAALALAQEIGLPGEAWPILGELGRLYAELGEDVKAKQAYGEAGVIIRRLAETIEDEGLREGFVTAVSVRSILETANNDQNMI